MHGIRFFRTLALARREIKQAEADERKKVIEAAVRSEIIELFNSLSAQRQAELVGAVLRQENITDELLRRFVVSCPNDKHVEVSFPHGETIIISGTAPQRRGPGW